MPEQLQALINRIKEWWNKFTKRQKGIIIGLSVFTVVAFVVIILIVSRPQYTLLITCEDAAQSAEVIETLDGAGITSRTSNDALRIEVLSGQYSKAAMAIASAGVMPDGMTLDDVYGSAGLSTTTAELTRRYQLYMESQVKDMLEDIEGIKTAKVSFHIPEQDGTLIAQDEESSAYIQLETTGDFTSGNAVSVAKAVATFLGNDSTANITIVDQSGELLFAGGDDYSVAGVASSLLELRDQTEYLIENKVKRVMLGSNRFNDIEVTSHLDMNFEKYTETIKEYSVAEGREEGYIAHEENYESTAESGAGGEPGTGSNGESTTYVTSDYGNSSSQTTENEIDRLPNEYSKYSESAAGSVNYGKSSIAIAAISYKRIYEEEVKNQGLLDGITWEEYKAQNGETVTLEVQDEWYGLVSAASGVPRENISIMAYEEPVFYDKESLQINTTAVISALLFILILGLLAFVVLRSMGGRRKDEEEEPEEIDLKKMLQSEPEETFEAIDTETKSEQRRMIEEFVDRNPEAAAALLRNWLQDDWG